jgi:hypothetical protein
MNRETAKELLSTYLQSSGMEFDPHIQEALALAESDPELQEWLQLQSENDPAIREALEQVPVPDGLEDTLLEIVRKEAPAAPSPRRFRPMVWGIGVAAALVLGAGLFLKLRSSEDFIQGIQHTITGTSPDDFTDFRDGMAYYIRNVYFQLDHLTTDLGSIEQWLGDNEAPVYEGLPEGLTALVPIGCKQLSWKEQNVSLVCFHTAAGKIVHLFILEREGFDPARFEDIGSVATSHALETGGWTTDGSVYLLVGSDPEVDIEFALG